MNNLYYYLLEYDLEKFDGPIEARNDREAFKKIMDMFSEPKNIRLYKIGVPIDLFEFQLEPEEKS